MFFGKSRRAREKEAQAQKVEAQWVALPPWHNLKRVMDLTGDGDWLLLKDLFTGIAVFGSAGSGKTSSLAFLAYLLMELKCGFVWMCAKPDEVQLVKRIAAEAGRSDDVVVLGEDSDGSLSPHRFNPLEYESSISTTGTGSVVQYLSDCAKVLSRKDGERNAGEGERFWNDQFERLLRYCIDTAKFAGRPLCVDLLRRIQLSAPTSTAQLADDTWSQSSICWQCLQEAEARIDLGEVAEVDFERILTFWTKDYANLDIKPRSTIDVMFAVLADAFYAEEPIRSILTTTTTITPDNVLADGKIVVLGLPSNIYHASGRMAQFTFKYSFQRAMLRRRKPADGTFLRPTVLWVDEAHAFAHSFDTQYFAEVRSNRGINVFLEQGIGGYMRALGLQNAEEVDGFLQNLGTKIFFQNTSPQTNRYAAEIIGKRMLGKATDNWGHSASGGQMGGSETQEIRYQVLPIEFGELARGGGENDYIVEGYILMSGQIFSTTGTNYSKCRFRQTEFTR